MGIRDRDYMKRPRAEDGTPRPSSNDTIEDVLGGFLQRHPRFFLYLGLGLGALILIGLVAATLSGGSR